MKAERLRLFYQPADRLRLTVSEEQTYLTVKAVWSAPLSRPDRYLALLDEKGEEIALVEDMDEMDAASQAAVRQELYHRYVTSMVTTIVHAKQEFGETYWTVETNRGRREFVTRSLQENAQWYSDRHLLLVDVDGNRFEIPDVASLDSRSQAFVEAIL